MKQIILTLDKDFKLTLETYAKMYELENHSTEILIRSSSIMDGMVYQLHKEQNGVKVLVVLDKTVNGLSYVVDDGFLAHAGNACLQIRAVGENVAIESNIIDFRIGRFINATDEPTPEQESVLNKLLVKAEVLAEKADELETLDVNPIEDGIEVSYDGKKYNITNGKEGKPGQPGMPGYTPVKGKDYWTSEDKAEIVSDVTPVIDSVVSSKVAPIENRLDDVEVGVVNIDIRVRSIDNDLTVVDGKVGTVEEKLYGVNKDIELLAIDVADVKTWSIQAEEDIESKQDKLTQAQNAGENITIDANGRISATGGGSGDVTKAYVDEQDEKIKTDLRQLSDDVNSAISFGSGVNLFDGTTQNGYYNASSFVVSNNYRVSNFIALPRGTYLYQVLKPASIGKASAYCAIKNGDSFVIDKTSITVVDDTLVFADLPVSLMKLTLTSDCEVALNLGTHNVTTTLIDFIAQNMVVAGSTKEDYPTSFVPYGSAKGLKSDVNIGNRTQAEIFEKLDEIDEVKESIKDLKIKGRIAWNGDSICYGEGYVGGFAKIIAERNGLVVGVDSINYGVSSATIAYSETTSGRPRHCVSRSTAEIPTDFDYYIIEGGVNDASLALPMGTITDGYNKTLNDTTFCGAMESLCKTLTTVFHGKKVGYIAVHKMINRFNSSYVGEDNYYNKAIEICKKWGIPVCDLNDSCAPFGYIQDLATIYTKPKDSNPSLGDGWHPNELGYKKYYCDKIESFIKSL